MRTLTIVSVLVALSGLPLIGCGTKASDSSGGVAPAVSASRYGAGPRAGAQPVDESQVARGSKLFKDKGCSACHAFGTKLSCPDLNGVTTRRTAQWMENQILHPEVMTREDPISHELLAKYSLQMPNQKLKPDEAKSVIEFLKHKNHETAETH